VLGCIDDLLGCLLLLCLRRLLLLLRLEGLLRCCLLREIHMGSKQPRKLILLHVCLLFYLSANVDASRYGAAL
jgi:hypothetical protein